MTLRSMRRGSSKSAALTEKEKKLSNKEQGSEKAEALAKVVGTERELQSNVKQDAEENFGEQMAMAKIRMHRARMRKQFWARMVLRMAARRWVARRQAMHEANDKVGRKIIQQKMSSNRLLPGAPREQPIRKNRVEAAAVLYTVSPTPPSEKGLRRKLSSSKPETQAAATPLAPRKDVFEAVAHRRWQATRHPESPAPADEYSPYRKRTGRKLRTKEKQGPVMTLSDVPVDFVAGTPTTRSALGSDAVSSALSRRRKPDMLADTWKEILSTVTCVRSSVNCVDRVHWAR